MSRLLPVPGLVLVLLLCLGLAVPPAAARADEVRRHELTPLPAGSLSAAPDGVRRGHGMERESLGIAVAAGHGIEARVTNGVGGVVLSLMTVDHETDVENPGTTELPADGSWRTIPARADSAVFVRSRDWPRRPVVEYRATGQHWNVPRYTLGSDQAAFVDGWRASGSPFAVIDDRAMTMLVPRIDLSRIADMRWSEFEDLDAVIRSYRRVIDTYDGWLGLVDGGEAPHTNRFQKPFLRPDATGWGLAYYMGGNYIGTNIDSVHYYLESPSAWLILHEVGHGYDGIMTSPADAGDMHLGEVWNNVYAYLYQTLEMGQTESNWLNANGKENGQRTRDAARHARGRADFNALSLADRLDVLTRVADLTGIEGLTGFNRGIREWRVANPQSPWPARTDLLAEHWGQAQGVNLLPWFELHSLVVGGRLAEELLDVDPHPIALPVADFFTHRSRAAQVATQLGLDGPGALAPADRLAALGLAGGLRVRATPGTGTGLEDRYATLWLGDREWARAPFRGGTADFGAVPSGAWTLRLPADRHTGAIAERRWVTVKEGQTTSVEFTPPARPHPAAVNGSRLSLLGLGDVGFATVSHDRAAGTMTVTDTLAAPHTYFPGEEYARITLRNGGVTLFDRAFVGDRGRQGGQTSTVVPAPVGSTLTITHREHRTRLVETDPFTGAAKPRLDATAATTTWVVTEHGLARQGTESGALADLVAAVTTDLERLSSTVAAHPGARLEVAATGLSAAVDQLPTQERTRLRGQYGALLERLIAPATAEVPPTSGPTPTPTPTATSTPTPTATTSPTPTASPSATTSSPTPAPTAPSSTPTVTRPAPATPRPSTTPTRPDGPVDVYSTPGTHRVGDRTWFTSCEPYSQTTRCRTEILATTVVATDGQYVTRTGFAFNNLTYLPSMTRQQWAGNPLARTGAWTAVDGRRWRTECDTAATGRGGCRSYAVADVVETLRTSQGTTYRTVRKEIFNNIVRFER